MRRGKDCATLFCRKLVVSLMLSKIEITCFQKIKTCYRIYFDSLHPHQERKHSKSFPCNCKLFRDKIFLRILNRFYFAIDKGCEIK